MSNAMLEKEVLDLVIESADPETQTVRQYGRSTSICDHFDDLQTKEEVRAIRTSTKNKQFGRKQQRWQ